LNEITDRALASVAGRLGHEAKAASMVAGLIGSDAPTPGRASAGEISAFWMAADQWMVEAPLDTHEGLPARLADEGAGAVSVTEQTDGWCRFDLQGARLPDVFALLCNLDVPAFTGGEATRCQIEHLGCFVICRAPDHISVIGPRSSAGSLHHALTTAMTAAL
jgi:sarcosine oxidase subunit gamma